MDRPLPIHLLRAARVVDPSRVLIGSLAVFFVGLMLAPVRPAYEINGAGVLYWLVSAIAAVIGLWLGSRGAANTPSEIQTAPVQLVTAARRTIVLGAIGIVLLIIERYALRDVPLGEDFSAVREALERRSPGVMGLMAAGLSAFAPYGLIMLWLVEARGVRVGPGWRLIALSGLLIYTVLPLTGGSRSGMLMTVLIHIGALWYLRRLRGRAIGPRPVLAVIATFVAVGIASTLIMQERLDLMGLDPIVSIEISGYAETLQPSAAAMAWLTSRGEHTALAAAAFSLCQYVFHGFFEFNLLFSSFVGDYAMGGMTLWLPAKVVSILSGLDLDVDLEHLAGWRAGIFTTFVGPLYADFGLFAPLVILVICWGLGWPTRRLRQGAVLWMPAACVAAAVILLFPVINMLDSASGSYLLVAALIIPLLAGRRRVSRGAAALAPIGAMQ